MILNESQKKKIEKVAVEGSFVLYRYRPTLLHPLLLNYDPMRFTRRVRYFLEYLSKGRYLVYYLAHHDDVVGFCVVVPAAKKLICATENDILLGPYYVEKEKRGMGYSKVLIKQVLENHLSYQYAFDWIHKTNTASIKASEACGFIAVADMNIVGLLRKPVVVADGGEYRLYRFKKISGKGIIGFAEK